MTRAHKFVLRPYAERKNYEQKQRARYLRKLQPALCRVCYGLPHVACATCPKEGKC